MSDWKAVWHLTRFSLRRDWMGIFFTFLFALYAGTIVGLTLQPLLNSQEASQGLYGLLDWFYLLMFPVFGQLMNRSCFGIWRDDVFTKKIAHWRTMPIRPDVIVQARLLYSLIATPIIAIAFMALQYEIAPALRGWVSPLEWLAVGLLWLCYALAVNAFLIFLELGFDGKRYVGGFLAFMLLCVAVWGVTSLGSMNLFRESVEQIKAGHYFLLPAALLIAAVTVYAGYRATLRQIQRRSYAF